MDGLFTRKDWELKLNLTGKGTVIAIIDSGINTEHSAFQWPASLRNREVMPKVLPAPDFSRNFNPDQLQNDITDLSGHGTLCAGITAGSSYAGKFPGGVAPQAKLIVCRTDNSEDQVAQALDHLIEIQTRQENRIRVHIVSMSFGYEKLDERIEARIAHLKWNHGTIFVASAGNDGQRSPITYPGKSDNVICIGANEYFGHETDFSTVGSKVVYLAPGKNIIGPATHTRECLGKRHCTCRQSPNHTPECAALQCMCPAEDREPLRCDSGTSFAAPAVAGLTSLFIELAIKEYDTETLPIAVICKLLERSSSNRTLRPKQYLEELTENPGILRTLCHQLTNTKLERRQQIPRTAPLTQSGPPLGPPPPPPPPPLPPPR